MIISQYSLGISKEEFLKFYDKITSNFIDFILIDLNTDDK